MTAYRDQYASLFNNGENVVVIGITHNPAEELHDWLAEADFPFLFATDDGDMGATYALYGGGQSDDGNIDSRTVIVVDPEGRVAHVIPQFNQVDPAAYEELAEVIDRITPPPAETP